MAACGKRLAGWLVITAQRTPVKVHFLLAPTPRLWPPYCCPCCCRRRAGKDPVGDSQRHPLQGVAAKAVTGEAVCVRRAPDLAALRRDLQQVLDAGGWKNRAQHSC